MQARGAPLTVATKTTLATLAVVMISFAASGALLLRGINRTARAESRAQAVMLARALAASFAVPLARGQHEVIQRQVDQMAELPDRFPDVVRVVVADANG